MRTLIPLIAGASLLALSLPAWAGNATGVSGTIDTTDTASQGYQGEVSMAVGTVYQTNPGVSPFRSLHAICTGAGNVSVTYPDGSTGTWAVAVGNQTVPAALVEVNSSGTTATCTYSGLK